MLCDSEGQVTQQTSISKPPVVYSPNTDFAGHLGVMKKRSPEKQPLSPLEIAVRGIATAEGLEGNVTVSLRTETYPATTYFTFLRFDVMGENKVLNILVKAVQQDPDLRTKFFVREKFLNEVQFYSHCVPKIRPILDKWIQEDPPKEVPVLVPSYYGHDLTDGQEWLAIEDIGPEYIVARNMEDLDKLHLKAAQKYHSQSPEEHETPTKYGRQDPPKEDQTQELEWQENITKVAERVGFNVDDSAFEILHREDCPTSGNDSTLKRFLLKDANKSLQLVMKRAVEDPDVRERHFVTKKFRNEVTFYDNVANRLEFVGKTRVLPKIPDVYDSHLMTGKEFLLLEDLVDYAPCKNPQNLDKKHMKAAIQALACFHSASLVWKTNNPAEFATVARLFTETEMLRTDDDPAKDVKTQKINAALGAATRACAVHLSGPYSVIVDKIYNSAFVECPTWVSMERAEPWSVITHGDCWAKNFLFKYDKNRKITGVALVDFKSARAASPVLDVTNFLLSSGSADCLKDLRPFIEKHKDSLTPKMIDYRQHVRLFGCYGVVAALVHHYYGVLYPNLDVEEATSRITMLEELKNPNARRSESLVDETGRQSAADRNPVEAPKILVGGQPTPDEANASRLRVALIVKAAHDVRMI